MVNYTNTPTSAAGGDLGGTFPNPTVTGTHLTVPLPVAQGGTNSATQNWVDLTTTQNVAGAKTFTTALAASGAAAGGLVTVVNTTTTTVGDMTFTENAAASLALACQVSGDTNPRVTLGADGKLNWGPGNGATDLNLYRNAANTLKTDFSFVATGSVRTGNVVTVGGTTSLGDNGAGELQITDVTTKPTTNPTAGVSVYSQSATSVPLKLRDTAGSVRGLVRSFALATGDQTSVSTTQTASTFLTAAVEANATYLMECWIYWTTANSATVTTSWSTTATGSTMIWNDTTTGGDIVTTLTGVSPAWTTGTKQIFLKGVLLTAGTPGNLTFTIASNVSASVTIKANGSALMLERVA